jgi:hypothetical protein
MPANHDGSPTTTPASNRSSTGFVPAKRAKVNLGNCSTGTAFQFAPLQNQTGGTRGSATAYLRFTLCILLTLRPQGRKVGPFVQSRVTLRAKTCESRRVSPAARALRSDVVRRATSRGGSCDAPRRTRCLP